MADSKKSQKNEDTLRAGVDPELEKTMRAEAKDDFENEAIPQSEADLIGDGLRTTAEADEDPTLLKELPEDGAVVEAPMELAASAPQTPAPFGRAYEDDFTGQGGTYVIDAKSGERKRQYEAVRDPKKPDKIVGYRPAV